MSDLYRREWVVTIGTLRVRSQPDGSDLTIQFEVNKSTEREPNSCSLKIANLSPSNRRAVEQLGSDAQLQLQAGYVGASEVLFTGGIDYAISQRDDVTIWTTIESTDGGTSYRNARISRAFERGVSLSTVIRACADSLGVGLGNTSAVANQADLDAGGTIFPEGLTLDDFAQRAMDTVCRSAGLRWSVQNGVIQLRRNGQPAETRAIRLSPGTGLVGSPSKGKPDDRTRKSPVSAKALLVPGIYPGRVIRLESSELTGSYQVNKVRYVGDSSGSDWYADMELGEY
jgi:hypothetical protein